MGNALFKRFDEKCDEKNFNYSITKVLTVKHFFLMDKDKL